MPRMMKPGPSGDSPPLGAGRGLHESLGTSVESVFSPALLLTLPTQIVADLHISVTSLFSVLSGFRFGDDAPYPTSWSCGYCESSGPALTYSLPGSQTAVTLFTCNLCGSSEMHIVTPPSMPNPASAPADIQDL